MHVILKGQFRPCWQVTLQDSKAMAWESCPSFTTFVLYSLLWTDEPELHLDNIILNWINFRVNKWKVDTHKRTSASRGNNLVLRLHDQVIFLKTAQVSYIFTHIIMKAKITVWGCTLLRVKVAPNVILCSLRKHIKSSDHCNRMYNSDCEKYYIY